MRDDLFSLKWLLGDVVTSVELDSAANVWSLLLSDGSRVSVPCLWRLLRTGSLSSTSQDHGHLFGLPPPFDAVAALGELTGKAIHAVEVRADTGDLRLSFAEELTLEVINTSAGFEGWSAHHPTLGTVFATGSGELNATPGV